MAFKVNDLCFYELPIAGKIVGFITLFIGLFNVVDLIDLSINYETRGPSTHKYIFFRPERDMVKWSIMFHCIVSISGFFVVIGSIKKINGLLLPWLILFLIPIAYGFIGIGWCFLASIVYWHHGLGILGLIFTLGMVIVTGLAIYVWLAIFSLYLNIRDEKRRGTLTPVDAETL